MLDMATIMVITMIMTVTTAVIKNKNFCEVDR